MTGIHLLQFNILSCTSPTLPKLISAELKYLLHQISTKSHLSHISVESHFRDQKKKWNKRGFCIYNIVKFLNLCPSVPHILLDFYVSHLWLSFWPTSFSIRTSKHCLTANQDYKQKRLRIFKIGIKLMSPGFLRNLVVYRDSNILLYIENILVEFLRVLDG